MNAKDQSENQARLNTSPARCANGVHYKNKFKTNNYQGQ